MTEFNSLRSLAEALQQGTVSAREIAEQTLQEARKTESVFIRINENLTTEAEAIDSARHSGKTMSPLAGIPISVKDLFNLSGQQTLAGSIVRKEYCSIESQDAEVLQPLRKAGLLFAGRTNMSEFAFSGIGTNAHYGTPLSIWDRKSGRLPGGSSSGSAVSVAENVVIATLGSDTAGSCRIPAAFNGIVGVKPSYGRMSLNGIFPLSPTSDAPGPLAKDVDSCFLLDQLMCGNLQPDQELPLLAESDPKKLKLAIPQGGVLQNLDNEVEQSFNNALAALEAKGIELDYMELPAIDEAIDMFEKRPIVIHEAYHLHRSMMAAHGELYDPFVYQRMMSGEGISDQQQLDRYQEKARIIEAFNQQFRASRADALIYPTVACIPPKIYETTINVETMRAVNMRCLRNTATANYFDGCSISLPCHKTDEPPVGLMVSSLNGDDEKLFSVCATLEKTINRNR